MKFVIFVFLALTLIKPDDCANILFLSGIPSPSHFIYNNALVEALAARGHNLTFVTPDTSKNPPPNVHYVHLEEVYSHCYNNSDHIDLIEMAGQTVLQSIFTFYDFGNFICGGIANSKGLNVIRNYPNDFKFDLVLNDYSCGACLLGLLPKFNYPPMIGISAFSTPPFTKDIVGGDKMGLTELPYYTLNYDIDMDIVQRLHNGFISFFDSFYRKYFAEPALDKQIKEMYGPKTPYAGDLEAKAVLMLVNSHPSVDFPESLPPNVIQVGGLQIKEPKQLPEELETFIRKGKKGTVLMSLGTNVRSDQLSSDKIQMVVDVFRKMPEYNFLWKFETSEMLTDLPKNVKITAWLPQNDILPHENVKLFITHGGLLSTHETTFHGVPMVGIPFIADQHRNLFKSINAGVAVKVDYFTMTEQSLGDAIREVLTNPKYKKNMEMRSIRFRDQPQTAMERAVWWSEYIIRNPQPTHLRPAKFTLGLLDSHFFDLQLLALVTIALTICGLRKLIRKVFHKNRRSDFQSNGTNGISTKKRN